VLWGRSLKRFSITLALKSLASSIFQLFSCGLLSQRFLIRIAGCTRKGKNWKVLMAWYVGSVCMQAYEPNTLLLDNSLATMGAGLPSAAAACLLHPEKKVVAVCGDGGFMLNSQAGFQSGSSS
jgi:hypothetical protein